MISAFRKRLGSVLLWGIILFVAVGLLVYLVPAYVGPSAGGPGRIGGAFVVATVGPDRILFDEFSQQYARVLTRVRAQYQQLLGDRFDEKLLEGLNLRDQVLEGLVTQRLILQRARALGVTVTPEELAAEIRALPVFAQRGFSKQTYLFFLRQVGTTPEAFEESFRRDLIVQRVEELIKAEAKVSVAEVREIYDAERQALVVEFVEITDTDRAKEVGDKLAVATSEGRDLKAAAQALGLGARTVTLAGSGARPDGVKDPGALWDAAGDLKPGQVSSLVQGAGAAYMLRLVERRLPSDAAFEKDKVAFRRLAVLRKRDLLFQEWLREARREAKVWVDRQALGG